MEGVDEDLKKLLRGEVVPLGEVDSTYLIGKNAADEPGFIPKVKKTVVYIVMAVLFDDDDRVVLVQEAKSSCRGTWYLPAGKIEKGENLLDGLKREVLEEAGVQFEPISFIGLQTSSSQWYRFLYVGKAVGGKLKTLAEQDSETLQANWFTIEQIQKGFVGLRAKDIIKPIQLAYEYMKSSEENRHPHSSILVQPHKHMVHRPVIYKQPKEGAIEVLCCKKNGLHIPSSYISPAIYDALNTSVCDILLSAFQVEFIGTASIQGLLSVEHCGEPAGEHDGICFTTAVTFNKKADLKTLENPRNTSYIWCSISGSDVLTEFHKKLTEKNLLVPVVGF